MSLAAFVHLDVSTLQTMQSEYTTAISAVAAAGQSYSISGRSFTRANLPELTKTLADINRAINHANGADIKSADRAINDDKYS